MISLVQTLIAGLSFFFGFGYLILAAWEGRWFRPQLGELALGSFLSQAVVVFPLFALQPAGIPGPLAWGMPAATVAAACLGARWAGRKGEKAGRFLHLEPLHDFSWVGWVIATGFVLLVLYPYRGVFLAGATPWIQCLPKFGDIFKHLGFVNALRDNGLPLQNPYFPWEHLPYYLFFHLHLAALCQAGPSLDERQWFALQTAWLGFLLCLTFFSLARRILGNRRGALVALLFLTLGNGMDFVSARKWNPEDPLGRMSKGMAAGVQSLVSLLPTGSSGALAVSVGTGIPHLVGKTRLEHIDEWVRKYHTDQLHVQIIYGTLVWAPQHIAGFILALFILGALLDPPKGWGNAVLTAVFTALLWGTSVYIAAFSAVVATLLLAFRAVRGWWERDRKGFLDLAPLFLGLAGGTLLSLPLLRSMAGMSTLHGDWVRVLREGPLFHQAGLYLCGILPAEIGLPAVVAVAGLALAIRKRAWRILGGSLAFLVPSLLLFLSFRTRYYNDWGMRGALLFQCGVFLLAGGAASLWPIRTLQGRLAGVAGVLLLAVPGGLNIAHELHPESFGQGWTCTPPQWSLLAFLRHNLPARATFFATDPHLIAYLPTLGRHACFDPSGIEYVRDRSLANQKGGALDPLYRQPLEAKDVVESLNGLGVDYLVVNLLPSRFSAKGTIGFFSSLPLPPVYENPAYKVYASRDLVRFLESYTPNHPP